AVEPGLTPTADAGAEPGVPGGLPLSAPLAHDMPNVRRTRRTPAAHDLQVVHIVRQPKPLRCIQANIAVQERAAEPARDGGKILRQPGDRHLKLSTVRRLDRQWGAEAGAPAVEVPTPPKPGVGGRGPRAPP